jgi:hypothetical protein
MDGMDGVLKNMKIGDYIFSIKYIYIYISTFKEKKDEN